MNVANARFVIESWDERPYSENPDMPKLTRASVTKRYAGDVEGEGHVEYLMVYRSDGSASFVGLERVVGRIGGRSVVLCSNALASSKADKQGNPIPLSLAPRR